MRRAGAGLLGVALMAIGLAACSTSTSPTETAHQYLEAWAHQDYGSMASLVAHPARDFEAVNRQIASDLDLTSGTYELQSLTSSGSTASASIVSHLRLSFGSLVVHSRLHFVNADGQWKVLWQPNSILPDLSRGDSLSTEVSWPPRATISGANGAPLVSQEQMVAIGIEGARATDPAALTAALVQAGASTAQAQAAELTAHNHPTWFIPVINVTQPAYDLLKPIIYSVPGTVFRAYSARSATSPELAAHIVGTTGPITGDQLKTLGPPYRAGDMVGQTGIEQAYERQLAGRPGAVIAVTSRSGGTVATLARFAEQPGTPVRTTIDPTIQAAAESALSGVTLPTDIVAIQPSTGAVLASVSTPDTSMVNEAFNGAYPPGSTFKVVTASDLIEHGLTLSSVASCPPTLTVNGATFHNFEGEAASSLTLEQAFARSCNTAFIGLSSSLPASSFASVAAQFGIGATLHLGLSAFGGKVPEPGSTSDAAATAIGQAQITVSPLAMANVAASIDSGNLRFPQLVVGASDGSALPQPLNATVVTDLRTMMNAVVSSPIGTAAAAGLPAGTFGKTGTAEFGTANPPQTHAWFIGYRGDLAFAVLVVGGGVGGVVAAPIAAKFLKMLGTVP